jgi:hypothetical protein
MLATDSTPFCTSKTCHAVHRFHLFLSLLLLLLLLLLPSANPPQLSNSAHLSAALQQQTVPRHATRPLKHQHAPTLDNAAATA